MKQIFSIFFMIGTLFCFGQRQNMLFQKQWGPIGEMFTSRIDYADQLSNGDYVMIGVTTGDEAGDYYYYACRTDSTGGILWERKWGGPDISNRIGEVIKASDESYVIAGTGGGGTGVGALNVSNVNNSGDLRFCNYFYFGSGDLGLSIVQTFDSSFVISGIKNYGLSTACPVLLKIDISGIEIWRRVFTTQINFRPSKIRESADSGLIVLGERSFNDNCYYARFDSDGQLDWIRLPFGTLDTITDLAGSLRCNGDGTFDIYYRIIPQVGDPPTSVYGIMERYDAQGDSLTQRNFYDDVFHVWVSPIDSQFYALSNEMGYWKLCGDSAFVSLTDCSTGWISAYIQTRDGGYLGFGQLGIPSSTWNDCFLLVKFGPDGRSVAQTLMENFNVYPNPCFEGNTTLSFDMSNNENVQIRILSMDGRLVYYDEIFCPANSHTEIPIHLDQSTATAAVYTVDVRTSTEYRRELLIVGRRIE